VNLKSEQRQFLIEELEVFGGPLYRPEMSTLNQSDQSASAEFETEKKSMSQIPAVAVPAEPVRDLAAFNAEIRNCQKCPLGASRTKFVFGVGNPKADLLFIGEAPGRDEDLKGEPFVGRAGQLLDKILKAINLTRQEVYIANVLKCRPPNNRDPVAAEVEQCEPYLVHQIQLIEPKLIVALGRIAARTLLRVEDTLKNMRQREYTYHGVDLRVTYHPAALLRNSGFKRPAWEDFQKIRDLYLSKTQGRLNHG